MPVPLDIHLIFLWVALANLTLFTCLLHINAAKKVASLHLMRQLWLLLGRLTFSSFLLCEAHPTTHVCLGWFFTMEGAHIGPIFVCPRRHSSSDVFLKQTGLNRIGPWAFPLGRGWAPCGAQGPLLTLGILPLQDKLEGMNYKSNQSNPQWIGQKVSINGKKILISLIVYFVIWEETLLNMFKFILIFFLKYFLL